MRYHIRYHKVDRSGPYEVDRVYHTFCDEADLDHVRALCNENGRTVDEVQPVRDMDGATLRRILDGAPDEQTVADDDELPF
jgi:hypothetical protein